MDYGSSLEGLLNRDKIRVVLKQKVYEEWVQTKIFKKVGFIDHAFSHFKTRLNGYFCIEKKHLLDENESRKWILIKNIKNYSFQRQTISCLRNWN